MLHRSEHVERYLKVFVSVALRGMFLKSHNYYRGELKRQKELMRIRLNVEGLIHLPGLRLFLSRSSVATIKATWSTDRVERGPLMVKVLLAPSLPLPLAVTVSSDLCCKNERVRERAATSADRVADSSCIG